MSGFVCPNCNHKTDIFKTGGGKALADEINIPLLGTLPIDPLIVKASDEGKSLVHFYSKTQTAKIFDSMVNSLLN